MTRAMAAKSGPPVPAVRGHRQADEPTERHNFNWAFNWAAAERQFLDVTQPQFSDAGTDRLVRYRFDIESSNARLTDVFGLAQLKRQLEKAVLAPMRKPAAN